VRAPRRSKLRGGSIHRTHHKGGSGQIAFLGLWERKGNLKDRKFLKPASTYTQEKKGTTCCERGGEKKGFRWEQRDGIPSNAIIRADIGEYQRSGRSGSQKSKGETGLSAQGQGRNFLRRGRERRVNPTSEKNIESRSRRPRANCWTATIANSRGRGKSQDSKRST